MAPFCRHAPQVLPCYRSSANCVYTPHPRLPSQNCCAAPLAPPPPPPPPWPPHCFCAPATTAAMRAAPAPLLTFKLKSAAAYPCVSAPTDTTSTCGEK